MMIAVLRGSARHYLLNHAAAAALVSGGLLLCPAPAVAADRAFAIEAMSMRAALEQYAAATGRQLLYASDLVAGVRAPAVHGRLSEDEALRRLLRHSGLHARAMAANSWVIERDIGEAPERPVPAPRRAPPRRAAVTPPAAIAASAVPDVVVTGTNIRGADAGPSPVITIGRAEIDHSGKGTVAEMLAALPQNFGGTGTEDTSVVSSDHTVLNNGLGSGANLRGLGSDATLTLINGRRVAGSGGRADFTDLSTLPTGAVERIEVMADGASALYGSDAVGGVINVILRRDFDGAETRARLGSVTSGSTQDYQLSQLFGKTWNGGHALLAYEFQHREALVSTDRRYAASADLRPLGGDDFRPFYSDPGTILSFNPATGAFTPAYAIPAGQDGTHLTLAQLRPGANLENPRPGTDLLPDQVRHSLYATIEQQLAPAVTLYAEGRYSNRRFHFSSPSPQTLIVVTPANPHYLDVDGSGASYIGYSFGDELGPVTTRGEVAAVSATGGATIAPGGDWQVDAFGSWAQEITHNRNTGLTNDTSLDEALGNIPDNPATAYSPARDSYFNPYGDHANNRAVLDFVGAGYQDERDRSQLATASIKADGTVLHLPGGPLKLAVGGQVRREILAIDGSTFTSSVTPVATAPARGNRTIVAGFAELAVPLFGPGNALSGLHRLDLSLAVRREHYSDFGSTTNPKVGLVWEPLAGLRLRGSYGTSFRAPSLTDLGKPFVIVATQLPNGTGSYSPVLYLSGGNPKLKPERAKSWSFGFTLTPGAVKGLRFEATWFRTRFDQRIGTPVLEQILKTLVDPSFSPFVTRIDPTGSAADLAAVQALLANPASRVPARLPPAFFQAIVDGRVVNTSSIDVRGIDATLSQRLTPGRDVVTLAVNASYMLDYKTRLTPTAPSVERVNTLGFPNDLRVRGSVDWSRGNWGATLVTNYLDGFTDNVSVPARPVGSWTTFDLQIRYQPRATSGWLHGLTVSLSAQNLFDTDPPFVNQSSGIGYDASSADPLGRFVALQLIKRW
jgi:outer membrane receptor protein involved in Fe transport